MIVLLVLLLLLVGCSSDDLSGGATSESTNGIVVMSSIGTPVSGARVRIVDGSTWLYSVFNRESPVVEELISSGSGEVFPEKTAGFRTIFGEHGDESGLLSGDGDTLYLQKSVTLSGRATGDSVFVTGTPFSTVINNGTFSFTYLPRGRFSFYVKNGQELLPSAGVTLSKDTVIDVSGEKRLLFDDFERGFASGPLKAISTSLQWYLTSDSASFSFRDSLWIESSPSKQGNSDISAEALDGMVKISCFLGAAAAYPYAGIGVGIRGPSNESGYDLSGVSSISVRARGTGVARMSLQGRENKENGVTPHGYELSLTTSWQVFDIPVASLTLLPSDNQLESIYPWSRVSSDIVHLQFLWRSAVNSTDSDYWIEIDEIWFEGISVPF